MSEFLFWVQILKILNYQKEWNSKKTISASLTTLKSLTAWITTNWKILKKMGILDYLTCFLRKLYAGQEVTLRTGHETIDWLKIGKGVHQGCILSFSLFNLYTEFIMNELKVGIKIPGRNINNLRYTDDTTLMLEKKEELNSFLF